MSPDNTNNQEKQREAAQVAQKDASRVNERAEAVRNEMRNAPGALQTSTTQAERRTTDVAHDVKETCGRDAAVLANQFRDGARDALGKTQEAAAAVLRLIEAALNERADDQRVQTAALAASRVADDTAKALDIQSRELDRAVCNDLDEDRAENVRETLERATADLEATQQEALRDLEQIAARVESARRDQERLEDLREAVEQERRRAERERQA